MINFEVFGMKNYEIENIVFDLNGTLAVDGIVNAEVIERLQELGKLLKVYILTADTFGTASALSSSVPFAYIVRIQSGKDKYEFVKNIDPKKTIVIGNGNNDLLMMKTAAISIAVIGIEGCSTKAAMASDILVNNIIDAMDLILKPKRLIATLRI